MNVKVGSQKEKEQGGWWEDGGRTKGIWGKEVNWEHDNMLDSTEIFSYFIMYSLLAYLKVLFLRRNLKKVFWRRNGSFRRATGEICSDQFLPGL